MHFPVAGIHAALSGFAERPLDWIRDKCKVRQFADNKNRPGIDYPKKDGAPVHGNHRQRLIRMIADLDIVLPAEDLPKGCEPGGIDEPEATS